MSDNNLNKRKLISCRWEDWIPTNEELREQHAPFYKKIEEERNLKIKQRNQHFIEDNYKHDHPINPIQEPNNE